MAAKYDSLQLTPDDARTLREIVLALGPAMRDNAYIGRPLTNIARKIAALTQQAAPKPMEGEAVSDGAFDGTACRLAAHIGVAYNTNEKCQLGAPFYAFTVHEVCQFARAIRRLSDTHPQPSELASAKWDQEAERKSYDGYFNAFHEIADMLGIHRPQPLSPQEVFETQVKPELRRLIANSRPEASEQPIPIVAWLAEGDEGFREIIHADDLYARTESGELPTITKWTPLGDCQRLVSSSAPSEASEPAEVEVQTMTDAFLAATGQRHPVTSYQRELTEKCMRSALTAARRAGGDHD